MLRGIEEEEEVKQEIGLQDGIVFLGAIGEKNKVERTTHTHTQSVKREKSKKNNAWACDVINQNSIIAKNRIQTYSTQT